MGHPKKTKFLVAYLLAKTHLSQLFLIRRERYVMRFYPTALSRSCWVYADERRSPERLFRVTRRASKLPTRSESRDRLIRELGVTRYRRQLSSPKQYFAKREA